MSQHQVIVPPGMEHVYEKIHYAPAIRVGDTIYVSGQIGRDKDMKIVEGTEAQIVQAFENLKLVLSAAGASMEDIVDLTTFHTDMRDLSTFMQVKDRYLTRDFPAWTAIGAASLGGVSGLVIEIKAVAVRSVARSAA
jgi:enamine deaminase RidA (YjgF/YER057c/UK114 family)